MTFDPTAYRLTVVFRLKAEGIEPEHIAERFGMNCRELLIWLSNAKRMRKYRHLFPSTDEG